MDTNAVVAVAAVYLAAFYYVCDDERKHCLKRERLNWKHHPQLLLNEGQFRQYYRMSYRGFEKLVCLLAPSLHVDEAQSRRRSGIDPLTPVNMVQMCISWLAGYSYHPVRALSGCSKTAFYNTIYKVMDAIQSCDELQLRFPVTQFDQQKTARVFSRLSSERAFTGCVGAIDGWLCEVQVPRKTEVKRVTSFFSGHYQCYGVNVQACVDHHCRFTAISTKCPGGMGDALAYEKWNLPTIAEGFPLGLYLVGDNAYSNSNTLLTPFTKPKTKTPSHDSFNSHLSQLRIRVEMAFGLLVNKWRLFQQPLKVRMKNVKKVIYVSCILHNWCINQRLTEQGVSDIEREKEIVEAIAELEDKEDDTQVNSSVGPNDLFVYRRLYRSTQIDPELTVESELIRSTIVYKLGSTNQFRPEYNVRRMEAERSNDKK